MLTGGGRVKWQITEQGPKAVIEVWRPDDGEGLFKAWLTGPAGRYLLGTLMPENGRLFLRRTLSIDSLKRQGAWPIKGVEEQLVCSFRDPAGGIAWEDEVLRRSASTLPRYTLRREGEGFSLSFPFDPYRPFPLLPAFCFARVENGRLIFSFRKGGFPYIFQEGRDNREEVNTQRREHHGEPDHKGTQRTGGSAGI